MTSVHVICGLGPPIKNPGYAYVGGIYPPHPRPSPRVLAPLLTTALLYEQRTGTTNFFTRFSIAA